MRRLMRHEHGTVTVFVAVLLVVLMGMAAMVVDLGDAYWERRMLQNSADAAALAVAIDCSQGDCKDFDTVARDFADENNRRGARVAGITGPDGNDPTPGGGEVTVTAVTGSREEPGVLQQFFSGIFGRDEGLAAGATATAEWGTIWVVDSEMPLVVSICDWERYTGLTWEPTLAELDTLPTVEELKATRPGPYYGVTLTPPDASHPSGFAPPITLHESNPDESDSCTTPPGFSTLEGAKFPAGFGWLDPDKGACTYVITTDAEGNKFADAKGGLGLVGKNCLPPSLGQAVVIPLFIAFYGNVGNGEYQLAVPAAFYLTGYANIPGLSDSSTGARDACAKGGPYFDSKATCITGHFVQKTEAGGSIIADPSGGVKTVRLKE
jgi:Flp pilus assembly protein TadG